MTARPIKTRTRADAKSAIRLAAVRALGEIIAVLSRSTLPPQTRISRASAMARKALARYESYRRRASRRRRGSRGIDHGQSRRTEWIVSALLEGRAIDADSIARNLRMDVRTVYRDIAYLRERGVSIEWDRKRGTYRMM